MGVNKESSHSPMCFLSLSCVMHLNHSPNPGPTSLSVAFLGCFTCLSSVYWQHVDSCISCQILSIPEHLLPYCMFNPWAVKSFSFHPSIPNVVSSYSPLPFLTLLVRCPNHFSTLFCFLKCTVLITTHFSYPSSSFLFFFLLEQITSHTMLFLDISFSSHLLFSVHYHW